MSSPDEPGALDGRESARIERRDRKRRPRMVVDNAGVKRVLQALSIRRRGRTNPPPRTPPPAS